MIGWLAGNIVEKHAPGKLVLNVQGTGYEVETSLPTFFHFEKQTDTIQLYIHTIVREDAILLYGFLNKQEQLLFRLLIKVNGIGPKLAMGILSSISPDDFIKCIISQNTLALSKLPGIGKKTAERLVIDLQDKLLALQPQEIEGAANSVVNQFNEQFQAISALEALGYKTQEATKAVKDLDDGNKNCELLIRQALQLLSSKK